MSGEYILANEVDLSFLSITSQNKISLNYFKTIIDFAGDSDVMHDMCRQTT